MCKCVYVCMHPSPGKVVGGDGMRGLGFAEQTKKGCVVLQRKCRVH